jgi:hypothetical protein
LVIPLMIALPGGKIAGLFHGEFAVVLTAWLWSYLPVFSLVVFASSVATNTMRATALYFGLLTGAGVVFGIAMLWVNLMVPDSVRDFPVLTGKLYRLFETRDISFTQLRIYLMLGMGALTVCCLVPLSGALALKNYRKIEISSPRCWIQSAVIVVAFGVSAALVAATVVFMDSFQAAYSIP